MNTRIRGTNTGEARNNDHENLFRCVHYLPAERGAAHTCEKEDSGHSGLRTEAGDEPTNQRADPISIVLGRNSMVGGTNLENCMAVQDVGAKAHDFWIRMLVCRGPEAKCEWEREAMVVW
eukprot:CAMPEP_0116865824 /NCGR_PEP_ID=MMETSP0418-20121206/25676_1 /TAXON_ID=1158023 /ORGANISM="Astrosyne radiata, Strain 13vi08-1A" /LENGTH=119 /DNA_ID=CAMNT_0004501367 /DNA_START=1392 /DNA_END=1749 /DNA_ORIENTATION=+